MEIYLAFNIVQAYGSDNSVLIGKIKFEGNTIIKRDKLLDLVKIQAGDTLDKKLIEIGLQNILTEYKKLGRSFATVTAVTQRIRPDQVLLIVKISEGKALKIGKIQLNGNDLFSNSELFGELRLQRGKLFDNAIFERSIDRILRLYSEHGHPRAEIHPVDFRVEEDGEVDFTLQIDENELVKISKVKLTGLNKTKTTTILRELPIHPGSQFDQRKIDESYRILKNIGYFYEVEPGLLDPGRSPSEVVFNAKVTEAKTGQINGVIGYNPSKESDQNMPSSRMKGQKWTGMIEVADTNLFGTGRKIDLLWKSGMFKIYKLSYEEPWLFSRPIDAGIEFSAVDQSGQLTNLISKERSASFSIGTHLHYKLGGMLTVAYKKIDLPEVSYDTTMQSGSKYAIKFRVQRDSRDYIFNPTQGRLDSVALEISRGDFRLKKIWLELNQYFATQKNQVLSIGLHGAVCYGDKIPPTELFYLGGSNNLRGYAENWFRGPKRFYSNIEYRFLVGHTSQVFLFTDFGSVTSIEKPDQFGKLRVGYGFGVRLESRSGILRIGYGLARGDSPLDGKIHVNLGLVR